MVHFWCQQVKKEHVFLSTAKSASTLELLSLPLCDCCSFNLLRRGHPAPRTLVLEDFHQVCRRDCGQIEIDAIIAYQISFEVAVLSGASAGPAVSRGSSAERPAGPRALLQLGHGTLHSGVARRCDPNPYNPCSFHFLFHCPYNNPNIYPIIQI